jgi:hypothetical protein
MNPLKIKEWAEAIDRWRIFPRLFIITYIILILTGAFWFMGLVAPTATQASFMSVLVGAGAAWFGLYVNSGKK